VPKQQGYASFLVFMNMGGVIQWDNFLFNATRYIRWWLIWNEVHAIGVQGCGFLRRLRMLTTIYVAQIFINCCFICNKKLCYNLKDVYTCPWKEFGELIWDRILMTLRLVVSSIEPYQGNEGCRCDRNNLCTHLNLLWAWMKLVMNKLFPSPISFNVS
jgi:hypothetical protein